MNPGDLNLRQVDLNLLVALHRLLTDRSVTAAARGLGLSQPALSRMLSRLRTLFDDPLMVRMGREMVPTPRALALAEPLQHMLAEVTVMIRPGPFDPAAVDATVRLMASDAATEAVVTPWVNAMAPIAPRLRYDVVPFAVDAVDSLARGTVDFAIDVFPDPIDGCRAEHLIVDRFACVTRADHPAISEGMTRELYESLDHIAITGTGAFVGILEQELARLGVRRNVVFRTTSMATAPFVASQTDWVVTVPSARARRSEQRFGVRTFPLPLAVREIPLSVLWHERTETSPLHRWMRACLPKIEMPSPAALDQTAPGAD